MDALLRKILYGGDEDNPKSKRFSLNRGQMFPEKQTILDYRYDEVENFWPWLKSDDVSLPTNSPVTELMVPTKETSCITYWLDFCLSKSYPILLVGPTGTGKSATIYNYMKELPKEKYLLNVVNFSARTSAQQVSIIKLINLLLLLLK